MKKAAKSDKELSARESSLIFQVKVGYLPMIISYYEIFR